MNGSFVCLYIYIYHMSCRIFLFDPTKMAAGRDSAMISAESFICNCLKRRQLAGHSFIQRWNRNTGTLLRNLASNIDTSESLFSPKRWTKRGLSEIRQKPSTKCPPVVSAPVLLFSFYSLSWLPRTATAIAKDFPSIVCPPIKRHPFEPSKYLAHPWPRSGSPPRCYASA